MVKKIIFIENIDQAKEYFKRKEEFKEFFPITFTFLVEKIFLENKIDFKTEDDYEGRVNYKNILFPSIKTSKKICDYFELYYKKVDLFNLFHSDLSTLLSQLRSYLRILLFIIKKENPEEIIIFESQRFDYFKKEFVSEIIPKIFKKRLKIIRYKIPNKKKNYLIEGAGFLQNKLSKIKLKLLRKEQKKIFFSGPKSLFESTFQLLLNNKNNHLFRGYTNLQKGFFINKKYIPFYEFSGIKNEKNHKLLEGEINTITKKINETNFSKNFGVENELGGVVKNYLMGVIDKNFIKISYIINEIEDLIKKDKINLVILHNDVAVFEKMLSSVSKINNIPTIVFQHGMYGNFIGALPTISDYILTYGEESNNWFVKNKTPEKKLKTIGCPRYDSFNKPLIEDKNKTILCIIDACDEDIMIPERELTKKKQKEILRAIFMVIKKFPDYKLIIKTRVKWNLNELPMMISKQNNFENLMVIEDANNLDLIDNAEIVINHFSTMGLESVIRNKPVICFSFKNLDNFNMYKNSGVVVIVYNEKNLENAIRNIIERKKDNKNIKRRRFLKKQFYKLDGKASQRAAKFIEDTLKNRER